MIIKSITLMLLSLLVALLLSLIQPTTAALAQTNPCPETVTGSHKGERNTTHSQAFDGQTRTFFNSSHGDWQHIQIDLGCELTFSGLRRYMTTNGTAVNGQRTNQGEGVSISRDGRNWTELTGPNSRGWDKYINYGARRHAWHSVPYGWSNWLTLQTPATARYIRFNWDDNADALNEIELNIVGDNGMLAWAQENAGGQRRVLLRWFGANLNESYTLYRRTQGTANWTAIGGASFAANAQAMANILGPNLLNQLAVDLDDNPADGPLTQEQLYQALRNNQLARVKLAEANYEVALAVGAGYLDTSAPANQTLEYYVARQGSTATLFGPVTIAPNPGPYPLPTDVRESSLFQNLGDLGVWGSSRPLNSDERYQWDRYQVLQAAGGKALLHWDATQSGTPTHYVAGYHVYRRGAGTGNAWQLANAQASHQVRATLISPNAPSQSEGVFTEDTGFIDDANFEDDLKTLFPNLPPATLYTQWTYRVCPVDLLGNEQGCTPDTTVHVRELSSPVAPNAIDVTADADHTQLAITLHYSDTGEISLPLRVFLLRNEQATSSLDQWTELASAVINNVSATTVVNFSDAPPRGTPFWYRVQVRDNAGNWSPAGTPVNAGLYPRTPPPFPPISQNADCNLNTMPLTLTNLDPVIRQIAVYRSFVAGELGTLLKRVIVENGAVVISEDFIPPYMQIAYYQLEAVDGHGNHSLPQNYCARLDPEDTPSDPTVSVQSSQVEGNQIAYTLGVGTHGDPANPGNTDVTVTRPGESGLIDTPASVSNGRVVVDLDEGETAWVTARGLNVNGVSEGTSLLLRHVNNFLNTNRQMTTIRAPWAAEWVGGVNNPSVRLHFQNRFQDNVGVPEPWVAIFRQSEGGNWLQVTPVQPLANVIGQYDLGSGRQNTWVITDNADPDPFVSYVYTALAFSPTSFEVLGYWEPLTLKSVAGSSGAIRLTSPLALPPRFPNCAFTQEPPKDFERIELHNGWTIKVDALRRANNCQDPAWNPNGLYGSGMLSDGSNVWPIDFVNITVAPTGDPTLVQHTGGRIALDTPGLNQTVNMPDRFPAQVGRIEFLPGQANAEIVLTLPANVKVVDPGRVERSNQVTAVFANVTPALKFDPVEVATGGQCDNGDPDLHLLDEHLPWRLHANKGLRISMERVELLGTTCTSDRLGYAAPAPTNPSTPDNNLAFLRILYRSENAQAGLNGLAGDFAATTPLQYTTSLPAAFAITANAATVSIADSQIVRGRLDGATTAVNYFRDGTDLTYIRPNGFMLSGHFRDAQGNGVVPGSFHCRWNNVLADSGLDIGPGGQFMAKARLMGSQVAPCVLPLNWAGFGIFDGQNTTIDGFLYTAAVTLPPTSRTGAPTPAEHAWLQQPAPNGNGDLDPGLNINLRAADADFACYPHLRFRDLDLDLYVRRGGVSENLIINRGSVESVASRAATLYDEQLQKYNVVFVDNMIVPDPAPQVEFDLLLPYPSDVRLPLAGSSFSTSGCPIGGSVRGGNVSVLHRYWSFQTTVTAWEKTQDKQAYYAKQLADNGGNTLPTEMLRLFGSGLINGLGRAVTSLAATDDFAEVALSSEWFPNGDYGDITVNGGATTNSLRVSGIPYQLHDIKLSHYYVRLMDVSSLPDTLGLEMDVSLTTLPVALLDGNGNLTQESLKACSNGNTVGCGFVVVDGSGLVDYFGQIERLRSTSVNAAAASSIGDFIGDAVDGLWPVATNNRTPRQVQALLEKPSIHWVWPVVNKLVDLPIPVKFLANSSGGVLAGVLHERDDDHFFFPGNIAGVPLEVLRMDIAAVASVNFDNSLSSFQSEFGVFTGYAASQAALRALAMNRPNEDGTPGLRPFDAWSDVSADVLRWTADFGYTVQPGGANDPADLAQEIWPQWSNSAHDNPRRPDRARRANSIDKTYKILDAHFFDLLRDQDGVLPTYGITPLRSGRLLNCLAIGIDYGMGQAVFFADGDGFEVESLQLGVRLDVDTQGHCDDPQNNDGGLLHADWVHMDYNRDDEFIIRGENIDINVIDFLAIDDVRLHFLIGTQDGFERVEGSIHAPVVAVPGVDTLVTARLQPVVFVFGSGDFNGEDLHYIGGRGTAYAAGYGLGGALLLGRINPSSQVLRESDFGLLMEKFGRDAGTGSTAIYDGYYAMIMGALPIFGDNCLLEAGLAGEVRAWHWVPIAGGTTVVGGRVSAAGFGTLLCLLHQRVQLGLTLEQVANGWPTSAPTPLCTAADGCFVATGDIWMADGFGFCDPISWDNWESRWWGDSWCWTFGAFADIMFVRPPNDLHLGVELDFELLPGPINFDLTIPLESAAPIGIPPGLGDNPGSEVLNARVFLPVVQR